MTGRLHFYILLCVKERLKLEEYSGHTCTLMSEYYRAFYDFEAPSPIGERTNPEPLASALLGPPRRLRNQLSVISLGSRKLW